MTREDDNAVQKVRAEIQDLLVALRAARVRGRNAPVAKAATLPDGDYVAAKIAETRAATDEIMAKAGIAFAEKRISAHEFAILHATHLRLDADLPLPGRKP